MYRGGGRGFQVKQNVSVHHPRGGVGWGGGGWRGLAEGGTVRLLSRRRDALAVVAEQRGGARPGAVHQQQAEAQSPRAHRGQEEGHGAVGLQEEVAGVRLPGEQQQHEEVDRQGPPAAARPQEVRAEGVAAAAVVQAPAQVGGEGHVEEQELRGEAETKTKHCFYSDLLTRQYDT